MKKPTCGLAFLRLLFAEEFRSGEGRKKTPGYPGVFAERQSQPFGLLELLEQQAQDFAG
jgi:hypothetical protein